VTIGCGSSFPGVERGESRCPEQAMPMMDIWRNQRLAVARFGARSRGGSRRLDGSSEKMTSHVGRDEMTSSVGRDEMTSPVGRDEMTSTVGRDEMTSAVGRDEMTSTVGRDEMTSTIGRDEMTSTVGRDDVDCRKR